MARLSPRTPLRSTRPERKHAASPETTAVRTLEPGKCGENAKDQSLTNANRERPRIRPVLLAGHTRHNGSIAAPRGPILAFAGGYSSSCDAHRWLTPSLRHPCVERDDADMQIRLAIWSFARGELVIDLGYAASFTPAQMHRFCRHSVGDRDNRAHLLQRRRHD
jgi:hypothetical protein